MCSLESARADGIVLVLRLSVVRMMAGVLDTAILQFESRGAPRFKNVRLLQKRTARKEGEPRDSIRGDKFDMEVASEPDTMSGGETAQMITWSVRDSRGGIACWSENNGQHEWAKYLVQIIISLRM